MSHINLVPAGTILPFGGAAAPGGYVVCDGSSLLRAGVYAKLFSAIGTVWGTADGTHFNVPDLRGRFMRGHDNGAAVDPDAASRTASNTGGETGDKVGTIQLDAVQGHEHTARTMLESIAGVGLDSGTYQYVHEVTDFIGSPTTDGINGTPRTTSETRPVNACVNYIIKY